MDALRFPFCLVKSKQGALTQATRPRSAFQCAEGVQRSSWKPASWDSPQYWFIIPHFFCVVIMPYDLSMRDAVTAPNYFSQATEACIDLALTLQRPFAVCPCCVFPPGAELEFNSLDLLRVSCMCFRSGVGAFSGCESKEKQKENRLPNFWQACLTGPFTLSLCPGKSSRSESCTGKR